MNYIAEIRMFYDWNTFNSIPADAQALWHALMYLNNKCAAQVDGEWQWKDEFTVANGTLESILKFSRMQLVRVRNALIQAGRIEYRKGRGNQSGTYKIIPIDSQTVSQIVSHNVTQPVTQTTVSHIVTQPVTQPVTQTVTQPVTQTVHNLLPLDNYNNNINNNHTTEGVVVCASAPENELRDIVDDYREKISPSLSPAILAELEVFNASMGPDVISKAFDIAVAKPNFTWAYIRGILNNWQKAGVKTLLDVERREAQRDEWKKSKEKKHGRSTEASDNGDGGSKWNLSGITRLGGDDA